MKKILFAIGIAAVASLAACSESKSNESAENEGAGITSKIENCTNADSIKVYVEQATAYAQKLVEEGKVAEARKYLDQVTPIVQDKAPALVSTLNQVKATLDKLPGASKDSLETAVNGAVDAVKDKGEAVKDAAVEGATDAVNGVKETASNAVNDVKDAAASTRNSAVNHATNAINNAIGK